MTPMERATKAHYADGHAKGCSPCCAVEIGDIAKAIEEATNEEKKRRGYYQGIVYAVCNALDAIDGKKPGNGIVCGTFDEPSSIVELRINKMANETKAMIAALNAIVIRCKDGCKEADWLPIIRKIAEDGLAGKD